MAMHDMSSGELMELMARIDETLRSRNEVAEHLSVRVANILNSEGIYTIEDMKTAPAFRKINGLGKAGIAEINRLLSENN